MTSNRNTTVLSRSRALLLLLLLVAIVATRSDALRPPKETTAIYHPTGGAASTKQRRSPFLGKRPPPPPALEVLSTEVAVVDASATEKVISPEEYKSALVKTALTVAAACLFGLFLTLTRGKTTGYEFFTSYLVEQSLSIDNLFVFIMLFDYFKVPNELQSRVLTWGIVGAVGLRGLMIYAGVAALQRYKSVMLVFAAILLMSSVKLLTESPHAEEEANMSDNVIMKFTSFLFPNVSKEFHGEQFFVKKEGRRFATPLLMCLVCVELSDFVFAVDSIPAVLGVTQDPMVVYASNIFAIMALRSLYTVVAKAVSEWDYLKPAVALVLGFVGSKMILEYFHMHIGTGASLAVICTLLGGGVAISIFDKRKKEQIKAAERAQKAGVGVPVF
jgi:TerC family integral membrane protein